MVCEWDVNSHYVSPEAQQKHVPAQPCGLGPVSSEDWEIWLLLNFYRQQNCFCINLKKYNKRHRIYMHIFLWAGRMG